MSVLLAWTLSRKVVGVKVESRDLVDEGQRAGPGLNTYGTLLSRAGFPPERETQARCPSLYPHTDCRLASSTITPAWIRGHAH